MKDQDLLRQDELARRGVLEAVDGAVVVDVDLGGTAEEPRAGDAQR
jgi:hypothetical protein